MIVTFFLTMCVAQLNAQFDEAALKKMNVREIIKKTYFNEKELPSMTYFKLYDKNGRIYEQISFNNNLNYIAIKEYYFYNDKGQLIEKKGIHYTQKDSIFSSQKYVYNSKGELDSNSFGNKIQYKYDKNGKIIESIEKMADPRYEKTLYSYNSIGQLIELKTYWGQNCISKINWEYNEKGQIKKTINTFYKSGNNDLASEYECIFFYNENGLLETEYQRQTKVLELNKREDNRIYTYEYLFYSDE